MLYFKAYVLKKQFKNTNKLPAGGVNRNFNVTNHHFGCYFLQVLMFEIIVQGALLKLLEHNIFR